MKGEARIELGKISDLIPDLANANKGTQRGRGMVEASLRELGAGRSVVLDRKKRLIAGNKTHEAAGGIGFDDVIMVHTDGTKLVAVVRDDLDLDDGMRARRLAIADNRTSEVGLEWDAALLSTEPDLTDGFWTQDELVELGASSPSFEPVGADQQGRLDEKAKTQCPECGHVFEPQPLPR